MRGMSDNNYAIQHSLEKQQHKQTLEHERNASLNSIKIAALVKKAVKDVNSSNNKYKQQQQQKSSTNEGGGEGSGGGRRCIGDIYTGAKVVAQTLRGNCNTNYCGSSNNNNCNTSCDDDNTIYNNNTINGALSTITEVSIEESVVIDSADSIMHSLADDDSFTRRSLSPTPNRSGGGNARRVRVATVSPDGSYKSGDGQHRGDRDEEEKGWQQKSIQWIDDVLPNLCSPVAQVCGAISNHNEPTPKKRRSYSNYYSNKGFCIPQEEESPTNMLPRTMSQTETLAGTLSNDEETTTALPSIISDNEYEENYEEEDYENDISVTLNNMSTSISDHLLNKKQQTDQQVDEEGRLVEERLQPSMYSYTNDTSSLSDYILKKQEEMQSPTTATSIDNAGFPTTLEQTLDNNPAYKSQKRTAKQNAGGREDELQCLDHECLNKNNIPCDEQKQDALTQFATSSVNILSYVISPLVSGDICNTKYSGIISDKCSSVCATTIGTNNDDTMTTIISEHTKKQMERERQEERSSPRSRDRESKESMDMEITIDTAETQMFLMRLSNQIPSYDMADQSTPSSIGGEEHPAMITPISKALETLEEEESTTQPSSIQSAVVTPIVGVNELYPTSSILQKQNTVLSDDSPDRIDVNLYQYQVFDDKSIKSDKVEEIVSSLSNESGTCGGSLSSAPLAPPPPPTLPFEQRKQLLKTNDNGMIDKGLLDVYSSRSSVSCRLGIAPVHSMDSQSVTDDDEEDDDHFASGLYTPTALSYGEKFGKTTSSLSQMLIDTFHLVSVGDDDEISDIKSYHTELLLGTTPKGKSVETQLSASEEVGDPVINTNCPHDEQHNDGINNLINRWEGMTTPKQTNASSGKKKTYQVVSKQQELPPAMPEIKKKLDYNVPKKKKTAAISAKEEEEKLIQIQNKISKMKKRQLPNNEVSTPTKEKEETKPLFDNDNTIQQKQEKKATPSSPKPVWNNDRLKRAKMKRKERIRSRATS